MIEATKGPVLPRQSLRDWVLQQRRSGRSVEAVDRYTEILKALDALAGQKEFLTAMDALAAQKELPPAPGATPVLEPGECTEDAAGYTMQHMRSPKSRKRRNVARPNVTRKASRIVKRSDKEERNQRNQRDAAKKAAKKAARKGGRPQQGPAPMTPAERVKAYRERMKAAKGKTGGRRGRKE